MSPRSTLLALGLIVAFCAAGLYGVNAFFGREAEMRSAERDFRIANHEAIQARIDRLNAEANGGAIDNSTPWDEDTATSEASSTDLDDWYAAAGSNDGPADVSPEDKSYLINEAEPTSDGKPIL